MDLDAVVMLYRSQLTCEVEVVVQDRIWDGDVEDIV